MVCYLVLGIDLESEKASCLPSESNVVMFRCLVLTECRQRNGTDHNEAWGLSQITVQNQVAMHDQADGFPLLNDLTSLSLAKNISSTGQNSGSHPHFSVDPLNSLKQNSYIQERQVCFYHLVYTDRRVLCCNPVLALAGNTGKGQIYFL